MNTAQQLLTLIGQRKLTTEEVEQIKVLRRQDIHLVLKNSIITAYSAPNWTPIPRQTGH